IHRRWRNAQGSGDFGFGGRVSVQIGVGVNEGQITALRRSEVSHDIRSLCVAASNCLQPAARLFEPLVCFGLAVIQLSRTNIAQFYRFPTILAPRLAWSFCQPAHPRSRNWANSAPSRLPLSLSMIFD